MTSLSGWFNVGRIGSSISVAILVSEILDLVSPKDFGMT